MNHFDAHVLDRAPQRTSWLHVRRFDDRFDVLGDREHASCEPRPESAPPSACWRWSGQRLSIETDRLGLYPLYYFHNRDEFGVSTSFTTLARLRDRWDLDDDALSVFFRLQNFVGNSTPFLDIKRVPPATTISWDESGLRESSVPYHQQPTELSRTEAIDAFIDLFRKAMKGKLVHDRIAVPLSGGRDSRHIIFEMAEHGRLPAACFTLKHIPPRPDEDSRIASIVARRLGCSHVVLEQPRNSVRRELNKFYATNFESNEHTQFQPLVEAIDSNFDSIVDGFGGDFLSNAAQIDEGYVKLAHDRHSTALAIALFDRFCPWFGSEATIRGLFGNRFDFDRAIAALEVELARHFDEPNPLASFYFWNRGRRNIAQVPCCLHAPHVDVHLPYVEAELFDFLMSLPIQYTVSRTFHEEAIARAYPRYADIPYEDKHAPRQPIGRWSTTRMDLEIAFLAASHPSVRLSHSFLVPRLALRAAGSRRHTWALSSEQALYYLVVERLAAGNSLGTRS